MCSLILSPIILLLNAIFAWLHQPWHDAIRAMNLHIGSSTGTRVHQVGATPDPLHLEGDPNDTRVYSRRRSFGATLVPYYLIFMLACGSIVITASVTRPLSSAATLEWLRSVVVTLLLKWVLFDPLKVLLLSHAESLARRRRWSEKLISCINAVCIGHKKQPHRFRNAVGRVIQIEASLKDVQKRLLSKQILRVHEREAQALQKVHDTEMLGITSTDIRLQLQQRHQQQRQEMLNKVRETDRIMKAMVDAGLDRAPAHNSDCVASDIGEARALMREFSSECDEVLASIEHRREQSRKVRAGHWDWSSFCAWSFGRARGGGNLLSVVRWP